MKFKDIEGLAVSRKKMHKPIPYTIGQNFLIPFLAHLSPPEPKA